MYQNKITLPHVKNKQNKNKKKNFLNLINWKYIVLLYFGCCCWCFSLNRGQILGCIANKTNQLSNIYFCLFLE